MPTRSRRAIRLLSGVSAIALAGLASDALAAPTTCSNGGPAVIDQGDCYASPGDAPTTVQFAAGTGSALLLDRESPSGAITAAPGQTGGNIYMLSSTTLRPGATIDLGADSELYIAWGNTLDASAVSTITIGKIFVGGGGGGNGKLILGNTAVTATDFLIGGDPSTDTVVVAGDASFSGVFEGLKTVVRDGKSLTINGGYGAETTLGDAGGGATMVAKGNSDLYGAIDGDQAGKGRLIIDGTIKVYADIGSSRALANVTVNAGRSLALTLNGGNRLSADAIILGDAATLRVHSHNISGSIDGDIAGHGIVHLDGGGSLSTSIGATSAIGKLQVSGSVDTGSHIVRANAIELKPQSALTVGSGLAGPIDGETAGAGQMTINSNLIANSSIGATRAIGKLVVNGAFDAGLHAIRANSIELGSNGILTVGNGGLTGAVNGASYGQGELRFGGTSGTRASIGSNGRLARVSFDGTNTLGHQVYATDIFLRGRSLTLTDNAALVGTVTAASTTVDLGSRTLLVHGSLRVDAGQTLGLSSAGGHIDLTGAGTLTLAGNASALTVNTTLRNYRPGDRVVIVNTSSAAQLNGGTISYAGRGWTARLATAEDASYNGGKDKFNVAIDAGQDIVLVALSTPGGAGGNASAAPLDALASFTGNHAGLQALASAVQDLGDDASLERAGAQMRPDVSGAPVAATGIVSGQVLNALGARSHDIRLASADGATGIASGDMVRGLGVWTQGFGTSASQDKRQSVDGYDAQTLGTAFGVDARLTDRLRAGLSLSYARTDLDNAGATTGSGTEVDSHVASLYGTWLGEPWHVDAMLGLGLHQYDSRRVVSIGAFSAKPTASFEGRQASAAVQAGYPLPLRGGLQVTPQVGLSYSHLDIDGYGENGSSGAELTVDGQTYDSLQATLGAKLSASWRTDAAEVSPQLRLTVGRDLMTDPVSTTQRFSAGGASFATQGAKPARTSLNVGGGLTLITADNLWLSADYDAEIKQGYLAHSGKLKLRQEF